MPKQLPPFLVLMTLYRKSDLRTYSNLSVTYRKTRP